MSGYHSNEELASEVASLAERAGERAAIEPIGATARGRTISAITVAPVGAAPDASRPQALVTANIHGTEIIASELALRLVERLVACEAGSRAEELLSLADVTVVPAVNLDSRAATLEGVRAAAPLRMAPRGNANGVDLNRNFPYPRHAVPVWHPLAGTSKKWLPWYRGPGPLSEPEAQALADLSERLRPAAALGLHSVGRYFLYPYCYTPEPPEHLEDFRAMGAAFVDAQPRRKYRSKQSRSWYAILGDLDDWLYDTYGTFAATIELSTPLAGVGLSPLRLVRPYLWMNPRRPGPTVDNTDEACLAALAEGCRRRAAV